MAARGSGSGDSGSTGSGSTERNGRLRRWRLRKRFWPARRRQNVAVLVGLMMVAILLLGLGQGIDKYYQNVFINVGADLVGALVTIFVIVPIVRRADEGHVREHPKLDYAWYVDQVAGATSNVRIMDTYSNLLDGPYTASFFEAIELALEREAVVQILLLDPDSFAARQRAHELDDPDVYREIMRNFRVLHEFRNRAGPTSRGRDVNVRMYTASPTITLYRWDEKALVSFFPVGKISSQGAQLEIIANSPLGAFVNERFNFLWAGGKDLGQFMRLPVTLVDTAGADANLDVEFVELEGRCYIGDPRMVAQLARHRTGAALAYSHSNQPVLNELALTDDAQPELLATLRAEFEEKYGHNNHDVFVCLEPVVEDDLTVLVRKAGEESNGGDR
jgi:hypothetical protein